MNTSKGLYDTKVSDTATAKLLRDAGTVATEEKDSAKTLSDSIGFYVGASDTAQYNTSGGFKITGTDNSSLFKVKKAAEDAAASANYSGLGTAMSEFGSTGKIIGDAAKARALADTNKTYTQIGVATNKACDTSTTSVIDAPTNAAIDFAACKTACNLKAHPTGLVSANVGNGFCYGI